MLQRHGMLWNNSQTYIDSDTITIAQGIAKDLMPNFLGKIK